MFGRLESYSRAAAVAVTVLLQACGASSGAPVTSNADDAGITEAEVPKPAERDLAVELERYLTGRFDSVAQAKTNTSYFEIQLHTCKVAAPALGAHVLYIEQARMSSLAAPYRQRLYVIEKKGEGAVSRVFELASPSKAKGLCEDPSRLTFDEASVTERAGCAVTVAWQADHFVGGTSGRGCSSDLNGASYATSEVTVDASGMRSWDRGFDAAGAQKWGAEKGAYEFERRTPL